MTRLRSIRVRLAAWYLVVLALCLAVFGAGMWIALRHSLMADVDADLAGHISGLNKWLQSELSIDQSRDFNREVREYAAGLTAGYMLRVWDSQGGLVFASPGFSGKQPLPGAEFRTIKLRGKHIRTLQRPIAVAGTTYRVECGASLALIEEILDLFRSVLLSLVPAVLLLSLAGGYWMSRRALDPVDHMTQAARAISVQNLSQRLAVPQTGDELQRLSETLNEMMERLETSVRRITQFTADASHELRTPIATMRTTAELALRRQRSVEEYREALAQILGDSERASQLLEDLLLLARADAGKSAFSKAPVALRELVAGACRQMQPIAEQKQIAFRWDLPGPAEILADRGALRRLLVVLLDNALKYTSAGGQVDVRLALNGPEAVLEVRDTGSGVAAEDLPHIFDRFYRADKARNSENGGFGLGLAIAREIVEAHAGRIEVESRPRQGSCFRVRLPRSEKLRVKSEE